MIDIISCQSAKRLYDMGFPQPSPYPGQFWFIDGLLFVICEAQTDILVLRPVFPVASLHGEDAMPVAAKEPGALIFAPLATDIYREMPSNHLCSLHRSEVRDADGMVRTIQWSAGTPERRIKCRDSAAEAASLAWLHHKGLSEK